MRNQRRYPNTYFSADILASGLEQLQKIEKSTKRNSWDSKHSLMTTTSGSSEWKHDNVEEFFADYRKRPFSAHFEHQLRHGLELVVRKYDDNSEVRVAAPDRADIESVFSRFESALEASKLPIPAPPPPPKPVIFIGHGHSPLWRDLKDHLHEQHGYQVEAYETGARAGHTIRDILAELVRVSTFALLVLTAEDEHADGTMHARENVIHEVGLFQGRLKYGRAIVLLEEGAKEFSNISGIHQIRFAKGNIKETYGHVLAALKREFGS
jgi:predicted nucleotide-binding protein